MVDRVDQVDRSTTQLNGKFRGSCKGVVDMSTNLQSL